jgi:hypothetical protein
MHSVRQLPHYVGCSSCWTATHESICCACVGLSEARLLCRRQIGTRRWMRSSSLIDESGNACREPASSGPSADARVASPVTLATDHAISTIKAILQTGCLTGRSCKLSSRDVSTKLPQSHHMQQLVTHAELWRLAASSGQNVGATLHPVRRITAFAAVAHGMAK